MPRAGLTPATVLATAAYVADRDGFEAVTLSAVARELGVRTASLYGHVRDRDAVLAGIHELALDQLADRIALGAAGRSGREALVGLADAQRLYAAEFPGRWAALQRPAAPSTVESEGARRVAELTRAVLGSYPLDGDELVHAARMLGACVNGFLTLEESGGFAHREPGTEASWQRTLTALDAVFLHWPVEHPDHEDAP